MLASGSRYRAELMAAEGLAAVVDPPDVDERAADRLFAEQGPDGLALELARRKAAAVAPRHPGSRIVAADQVGVVDRPPDRGGPLMLVQRPDADGAVAQLMAMAGTTHLLVNGLVVLDTTTGDRVEGVDVQRVSMRDFTEAEARRYVEDFEPFDCAGSYRLEDQGEMPAARRFVTGVDGEHPSGVVGLPLPLLHRLLDELSRR